MLSGTTSIAELAARLEPLAERGRGEILAEGVPAEKVRIERFLDMRYRGQSYELIVPFTDSVYADFHSQHLTNYGYAQEEAPVEVVNLRVKAVGAVDPPPLPREENHSTGSAAAMIEKRDVLFAQGKQSTPMVQGESLHAGNQLTGPAVIVRSDTTILLSPSDKAEVDAFGNLLIEVGA
jgi:N-methylhydantoinase A